MVTSILVLVTIVRKVIIKVLGRNMTVMVVMEHITRVIINAEYKNIPT